MANPNPWINSNNYPLSGIQGSIKIYTVQNTNTIACLPAFLCRIDEEVDLLPLWTTASAPFADILPSKVQPVQITFRMFYRSLFNPFLGSTALNKGHAVTVEFDTANGSYFIPIAYVQSLTTIAEADGMIVLDITLLGSYIYTDPGGNQTAW